MKYLRLALAIASFLFLSAAQAEDAIEREPIEDFLTAFDHTKLPLIDLAEIAKSQIDDIPLDLRVYQFAAEINQALFSTQLFKIRGCTNCKLIANLATFEIFVQQSYFDEVERRAESKEFFEVQLRYMLAHEFSHYLYEVACQQRFVSLGAETSPNGNKSFRQLIREGVKWNLDHQRAHAEVDLIAIVALERMGFSNAREAAINLLKTLSSPDSQLRILTLQALQQLDR